MAAFIAAATLAAATLTGCGMGRHPGYSPATTLPDVPFRTPAEHDSVLSDDGGWPYVFELTSDGGGALVYYGSRHTQNPDDAQIRDLVERFEAFAPTVALTENDGGIHFGGMNGAVRRLGEFGALKVLASDSDIPIWSMEPTWNDEVAAVTAEFPVEEVTLFYTLRVFISERGDEHDPGKLDRLASHLLKKRGSRPGLEGSLPDLEALDQLWTERFSDLGEWRHLPSSALAPAGDDTRLHAISTLVNEVRDRHFARTILSFVKDGHRVFAVAGGSHVIKQEPVIRAAVGE